MTRMPVSRTIPALLDEQALKFADCEAVVAGTQRLSYLDLRAEVRRTAKGLMALGVQSGDHVAILMGNRVEWVLAFLALQQLGATTVGLNTWATSREMEHALAHAEVTCLIAVDQFRRNDYRTMIAGMQAHFTSLPRLRHTIWVAAYAISAHAESTAPAAQAGMSWDKMVSLGQDIADERIDAAGKAVHADDVAMLLYTSGSTASPKGILLQHGKWIKNAFEIGERQQVTHADRLWLAVSLFWSFGCVNALPNLLTHGGCLVLQEHFNAGEALSLIERERCSLLYGTPNMVQALVDHENRTKHDLSTLRSGAMIGTPEQLMGAVKLGASQICNVYGLSETYGNCTVIDAGEPLSVRLQSVGAPLPGVTLRICHIETGAEIPVGEVGEIRVQGPLFSAYYKDEEKTCEAFDAQGFFCTGDLGTLDIEGRLYYRGRMKEMVKSGGINIAPIEVEETLMRHPAVRSAYVIGLPDPSLDEILVAIVILKPASTVTAEELSVFCKKELAAYKVPARFRFATDEELPLTTTGKLQKMKLKSLL